MYEFIHLGAYNGGVEHSHQRLAGVLPKLTAPEVQWSQLRMNDTHQYSPCVPCLFCTLHMWGVEKL